MWQSQSVVIAAFFFLFGIVIGSFLNVCITRIPEGLSIVSPGSRCPRCKTPIKPYDNIPVFGWLLLRGKCRSCGLPISPLYPMVELLTGLLFVACYYSFDISLYTFKWLIFCCLIVVLTVTDLRERILPDAVNWTGFLAGLVLSLRVPIHDETALWLWYSAAKRIPSATIVNVTNAVAGAAFGGLLLWGFAAAYKLARGRAGMGFGDVKMMAMVGTFLGVRGTFLTILFGALLGSIVGILFITGLYISGWRRMVARRASRRGLGTENSLRWTLASQYQLPLGTFLGIAAVALVFAHYDALGFDIRSLLLR